MSAAQNWFQVSKDGLAKLRADEHPAAIVWELISNALDTDASRISISLSPVEGKPLAELLVEDDDPNGFADLAHAYTLFAESSRKGDPEKRGRYNLGEKLVLARCVSAEIVSTVGGVRFDAEGRHSLRTRREKGTSFLAYVRMTRDALDGIRQVVAGNAEMTDLALEGKDVSILLNGEPIPSRRMGRGFRATLPTVRVDEEGNLRRAERETYVTTHEVLPGERARLYEMGIPVCELDGGETEHLNVRQKVPLTLDRKAATPAFLRALRVALLNAAPRDVKDATAAWVREAAGDKRCSSESIAEVLRKRFGENRVAYDPSDTEAVSKAVAAGATVVHGGSLSAGEWENARRATAEGARALLPAGKVYPSHMSAEPSDDYEEIPESKWTRSQRATADFARRLAFELLKFPEGGPGALAVTFVRAPRIAVAAQWGGRSLLFNVSKLDPTFFESVNGRMPERVAALVLHEFGHWRASNHLSEAYYDALCDLGARFAAWTAKEGWPSWPR